ncbi:MAG: SDR family NAD(P)-dependent oxidoreductase [Chlorobiales bacterium]|nr:SDR family NAD(P)-dependent oxidoreductase [Chlorobiales bacterium]
MELPGKLIVVTGASRGIGRALSKKLAAHKCDLLLTALEETELNDLSNELQEYAVNVASIPADLSNPESRKSLINWILNRNQLPDVLINNAGTGGAFGRFENIDLHDIERTTALNISALIHLTHELMPALKSRPCAKIVNISSGCARFPYPGLAVYGATKAFISSFSESLSCELSGTKVNVLCFHPGFTNTTFIESAEMDMSKVPRAIVNTPERVAARIVRAIKKDREWDYGDFSTWFGMWIGSLSPHRFKKLLFNNLFWEVPNGKVTSSRDAKGSSQSSTP